MNTDVYRKTCSCMFIAASCTENKPNIHQQQKRWTLKYSYNGTLHKKREGERREKETTNTHDTTCPKLCCKGKIQSQVQWLQILCFMEEIGCPVGVCVCVCVCVWVTQSCPTLCDPMDHSPPGSSVLGILQARILEWVAMSFSRGSSQPRDWSWALHIAGRLFTIWAAREALSNCWECYLEIFHYLAALSLSCGTWTLQSSLWHVRSLVMTCGI